MINFKLLINLVIALTNEIASPAVAGSQWHNGNNIALKVLLDYSIKLHFGLVC